MPVPACFAFLQALSEAFVQHGAACNQYRSMEAGDSPFQSSSQHVRLTSDALNLTKQAHL